MSYQAFIINTFTKKNDRGNPIALIECDDHISPESMKSISKQIEPSEVVFMNGSRLKFFASGEEISPYIDGIIAASHHKGTSEYFEGKRRFGIKNDYIEIRRHQDGFIEVEAGEPNFLCTLHQEATEEIANILNVSLHDFGGLPLHIINVKNENILIVPISSLEKLFHLNLDKSKLLNFSIHAQRALLYIFTFETYDPRADFHARYFNPYLEPSEEAATGWAASALVAYIKYHNLSIKTRFLIEQGDILGKASRLYVRSIRGAIKVGGYAIRREIINID